MSTNKITRGYISTVGLVITSEMKTMHLVPRFSGTPFYEIEVQSHVTGRSMLWVRDPAETHYDTETVYEYKPSYINDVDDFKKTLGWKLYVGYKKPNA